MVLQRAHAAEGSEGRCSDDRGRVIGGCSRLVAPMCLRHASMMRRRMERRGERAGLRGPEAETQTLSSHRSRCVCVWMENHNLSKPHRLLCAYQRARMQPWAEAGPCHMHELHYYRWLSTCILQRRTNTAHAVQVLLHRAALANTHPAQDAY